MPPMPPPTATPAPMLSTTEEGEELYDEAAAAEPEAPQVEDYLSFEPTYPASNGLGEEPQEVYEAMEIMEDQELYEEPSV